MSHLGAWDDALLDGVGLVVKSPGVPADAPPVAAARARADVPVISEIELGARLLANPIIGITGTNGKTTTTALLGAMFDGRRGPGRGGGQHRPAADEPRRREPSPDAWVVCELSSFQLEDVETLHCRIAVLLNLEPDHLDRHGIVRGLPRREAPHLRAPDRGRPRDRPARLRRRARARRAGSSSTATTRCRPSR